MPTNSVIEWIGRTLVKLVNIFKIVSFCRLSRNKFHSPLNRWGKICCGRGLLCTSLL